MFPCFYGIDMASKGRARSGENDLYELNAYIGLDVTWLLVDPSAVDAVGREKGHFCHRLFHGTTPSGTA